jgi:hypothetical protein
MTRTDAFDRVRAAGLSLPDVEEVTKRGAPTLQHGGRYMAALATHPSAEPDSLVVKISHEERQWLLDDAPDTYYVTDYYRPHPVVLVRLSRIEQDALRDVLTGSWRMTGTKRVRAL